MYLFKDLLSNMFCHADWCKLTDTKVKQAKCFLMMAMLIVFLI